MNQQKLRADAHKQIEEIFKTLLPARGLSYREVQAQLSHTMLDALLDGKIASVTRAPELARPFLIWWLEPSLIRHVAGTAAPISHSLSPLPVSHFSGQ